MPERRAFEVTLSDGATLSCCVRGKGIPVLWVSGLGGMASFWDPICPNMDGVMSIAFDQRGLGQSARGVEPVSVGRLACDAIAILDFLALDRVHVVGHSTGGCIAMAMALRSPDRIASLALSGSWAARSPYMQALFEWRLRLLDRDPLLYEESLPFLSNSPSWLVTHPHQLTPPTTPWPVEKVGIVRERIAALMAFDCSADLGRLELPALVIGAQDDVIVPVPLQHELANRLSNSTTYFFEYGGHFFPRSNSRQFVTLMSNWFDAKAFDR